MIDVDKAGLAELHIVHAMQGVLADDAQRPIRLPRVNVSTVCPGLVEDVGMYARHEREAVVHASRWIGTTTPHKVADAVVRALRANAPELIVSPGPFRVMMAAGQLFPAINAPVTNWLVGGMLRAVADHRRHTRHRPASPPAPAAPA